MDNRFKVLIVEDEILTATCLKLDIEDLGTEVLDPVIKGKDAVEVAIHERPDLILMDIRLAGELDGIQAAEKIYEKEKIPIVFFTGYDTQYFKDRAKKLNPVDILEKPLNIYKLKEIIDELKKEMRK